jgi:hypothetical protein
MWGFWEGAHWRPQAALWRRDWTPTLAAQAYRELVFEKWWTKAQGKANAEGIFRVRAFYGAHAVVSEGARKTVTLRKNEGPETVTFSF